MLKATSAVVGLAAVAALCAALAVPWLRSGGVDAHDSFQLLHPAGLWRHQYREWYPIGFNTRARPSELMQAL